MLGHSPAVMRGFSGRRDRSDFDPQSEGRAGRVVSEGTEVTREAGTVVLRVVKGGGAFLPRCIALKVQ